MGNRLSYHLFQIKSFTKADVDFVGSFEVRATILWKLRLTKACISIFVYMVTITTHIELVSDLSTSLFIAALYHFISERGRCSDTYSETQRYLKEIDTIIHKFSYTKYVVSNQIIWHINCSSSYGRPLGRCSKISVTSNFDVSSADLRGTQYCTSSGKQSNKLINFRPLSAMSLDRSDIDPGSFFNNFLTTCSHTGT